MTLNENSIMEGGCTCRQLRYRLSGTPLIVHACHCRWCQRETGTAFATNALYEADRVTHLAGEPDVVMTPSASGKGQRIARCPSCRVSIWSNYPQAGPAVQFIRVAVQAFGIWIAWRPHSPLGRGRNAPRRPRRSPTRLACPHGFARCCCLILRRGSLSGTRKAASISQCRPTASKRACATW